MDKSNRDTLETHVLRLYDLMQKMRADLSVLTDAADDKPVLDSAADQLVAISEDSEKASEAVLNANDTISGIAENMIREIKYTGARHQFQEIVDASQRIESACEIQTEARARISNVIETINLVEGTLNSLVVRVGDGSVTGVGTALSGISMMDDDEAAREASSQTIKMETHKKPAVGAVDQYGHSLLTMDD